LGFAWYTSRYMTTNRELTANRIAVAGLLLCAASLNSPGVVRARGMAAAPQPASAQTRTQPAPAKPQPAAERLQKLPAPLRERARIALAEPDEAKRGKLIEGVIRANPSATLDFALALLEEEASPVVRTEILDELKKDVDPRVGPALERRLLRDPDPKIAVAALEVLRRRATLPLLDLLERRLRDVRAAGDEAQLRLLADEHERWTSVVRGALLPTFMQQPPALFAAAPAGRPVRVLAFGDFGDGSEAQKQVAAAMLAYHTRQRFDFAVTLGDNFYSTGMASPSDGRWKTWWSDLYDPLRIPFYATLGNHDWGQPNSPAAEIVFSQGSPSWRMPSAYYSFTAGDAQFFALDTDIISEKQIRWLSDALAASTARWKIVYGHHPIYSEGVHEDNNVKIAQLLPVLRDRADVYLAGHDHDMQHLKPEGRLHFFIAGSGGKLRPIEPGPRSLFAKSANGFAVLEVLPDSLSLAFVDVQGQELYRYEIKGPTSEPPR
jgi:tartrate-resistant acid phosphatase type 5